MGMIADIDTANTDPTIFVIKPTSDLYDLQQQYRTYQSLPIDDMRMSDDKAMEIYGMRNVDLYNKLYSQLVDPPVIQEGFALDSGDSLHSLKHDPDDVVDHIIDIDPELFKKIEEAIEENSDTTVIIWPYNYKYPYTLEELEAMWAKWNNLSFALRSHSDEHSFGYFGVDVTNMYHTQKNILLSMKDISDSKKIEYIDGDNFIGNTNDLLESTDDMVTLEMKAMDFLSMSKNGRVYDAVIAEQFDIDKTIRNEQLISDEMPEVTPYLTPTEMEDLFDGELTDDAQSFLSEYKDALASGLADFDGDAYKKHIKDLFFQKQNEEQLDTIKEIDEQLLSFGWNPNVEPTDKAFKQAHDRIKRYLDENYKVRIVDATKFSCIDEASNKDDVNLFPIYIVLSYTGTTMGNLINFFAHSKYSHACIAFNPDLNPMYTYVRHGLSYETKEAYVKKFYDAICKVLVVFVTKKQKEKILGNLAYYISNHKHTNYAIDNIFNILFHRKIKDKYSLNQVCSQFVNQLLTLANINLFDGKSNNLVSPDDFDKSKNPKLYIVYEGYVRDYKPNKVAAIVDTIAQNTAMQSKSYSLKEAADLLHKMHFIESFRSIKCIESEIEANAILEQIHDLTTPESVLVEAKSLPFHINSKGITIELPARIEEQYQEVHKSLLTYEKENSIEQMKDSLAHLWYLNLLCERRIKGKVKRNKPEDAKKIRDTRARIMNDFKKYLKMVLKADPEFDFASHFDASKYNDRKLFLDKETLVYSGKAIAKVVKNILP